MYYFCFFLSLSIFVIGCFISIGIFKQKRVKIESFVRAMFFITFAAVYVLVIPINKMLYSGTIETLCISGIYTFKVFTTSASFIDFTKAMSIAPSILKNFYSLYGVFFFVFAPLLSVSVMLSIFRDSFLKVRLLLGLYSNIYIFSGINDKTVSLAKSCVAKDKKNSIVVFTGIKDKKSILVDDFKYVMFKQEIGNISNNPVLCRSKNKKKSFFVFEDSSANTLNTALKVIQQNESDENAFLYIFDDSSRSDIVISSALKDNTKLTVRRVNVPQSLIYNYLYKNNIFENVYLNEQGKKELNIKIIGFGNHGEEILKAVLWAGVMDDLVLNIDVFDYDKQSENRFYSKYPDIKRHNNTSVFGDANYLLNFHAGFDVNLFDFDKTIASQNYPSIIFIALGNDFLNIDIAIKLRIMFSRNRYKIAKEPQIVSVIYNTTEAKTIKNFLLTNEKGVPYNISCFGDIESTYSYDIIVNSELEKKAFERHMEYVKNLDSIAKKSEAEKFYKYEYYSKSSMASIIRNKMRIFYNVDGAKREPNKRTKEERDRIQLLEHIGWNNYMRCNGYVYGERNDFLKTHNCLVTYDKLPESEKQKDNC